MDPILIASDHAGVEFKTEIKLLLSQYTWEDLGTHDVQKCVDYPDIAQTLAHTLLKRKLPFGVLICGTGIGVGIAANRIGGIRAAVVENPFSARLSREHNDANVLCLGARILSSTYAAEIIKEWLETPFSGLDRHKDRIQKLN